MDLYQDYSNYSPGSKLGRPRDHLFYIDLYREKHTLQTSSPQKPLGQSKPNSMWSLHGAGATKVCSPYLGHKTVMFAMPIYGKNPLKPSSPEPKGKCTWGLVYNIGDMGPLILNKKMMTSG